MQDLEKENSNLVGFEYEHMERARRIEPLTKAWKAFVLPLNYARELSEIANDQWYIL